MITIKEVRVSVRLVELCFEVVGKLLCDDFVLDCRNGMTLRDADDKALAGGANNVVRYILAYRERHPGNTEIPFP